VGGGGGAGIPFAPSGGAGQKPMIYVRKQPKGHAAQIEGDPVASACCW
jgi:hypothetical protein